SRGGIPRGARGRDRAAAGRKVQRSAGRSPADLRAHGGPPHSRRPRSAGHRRRSAARAGATARRGGPRRRCRGVARAVGGRARLRAEPPGAGCRRRERTHRAAASETAEARRVKIVHLATYLQGGAGRIIVDLVTSQHHAGHNVSVVVSNTGAPVAGWANSDAYLDELARTGIPVQRVDSMFSRDQADNLAVVRALCAQFAPGHEPDVAHTHAAIPSLVALLFAGARRVPLAIVQSMHGWNSSKTPGQVATDVALMNLVDRVAVPSRHSADIMVSLGVQRRQVTVVTHGVGDQLPDLDHRDRQLLRDMERARGAGLLIVACVGTIGPRKSQRLLVDAVAQMAGPRSVYAVFIGDGDASELQQAVDGARLAGRMRVHGYSRAARRLAASADVLVLPSRSE